MCLYDFVLFVSVLTNRDGHQPSSYPCSALDIECSLIQKISDCNRKDNKQVKYFYRYNKKCEIVKYELRKYYILKVKVILFT